MTDELPTSPLRRTVLHDLHRRHGGRFGAFARWDMPIRYAAGPVAEHQQCRESAALFDVSHMAVVDLRGPDLPAALEQLMPADLRAAAPGRLVYSFLTDDAGGILDDLMICRRSDDAVRMVLNAATTEADLAYLADRLPAACSIDARHDLALVALQGPRAEDVLTGFDPSVRGLTFLHEGRIDLGGHPVELSRSGYTGGDGFELALPAAAAPDLVEMFLGRSEVALAGLAARDSLRLEAGLCLYGHDLDATTTPIEAGLQWAVPKSRRAADAGYRGAAVIARQLLEGPPRRRVGLRPVGRRPVREGAVLRIDGVEVGTVTSGGYSPVLAAPVAMGYVAAGYAQPDVVLEAATNDRAEPCRIVPLPFVAKDYHR